MLYSIIKKNNKNLTYFEMWKERVGIGTKGILIIHASLLITRYNAMTYLLVEVEDRNPVCLKEETEV